MMPEHFVAHPQQILMHASFLPSSHNGSGFGAIKLVANSVQRYIGLPVQPGTEPPHPTPREEKPHELKGKRRHQPAV